MKEALNSKKRRLPTCYLTKKRRKIWLVKYLQHGNIEIGLHDNWLYDRNSSQSKGHDLEPYKNVVTWPKPVPCLNVKKFNINVFKNNCPILCHMRSDQMSELVLSAEVARGRHNNTAGLSQLVYKKSVIRSHSAGATTRALSRVYNTNLNSKQIEMRSRLRLLKITSVWRNRSYNR